MSCCAENTQGPGFASPADAIKAEREKILYTVLVYSGKEAKPDALATIDADESSPTFSTMIHKLEMPFVGDELHHFGWNACSSCCDDPTKSRRFLVIPGLKSGRIYIVDTIKPRAPKIHKSIEPTEIVNKVNLTSPHTVHCLANGKIMISMMGDKDGNGPGGFLLLDENFEILGRWGDGNTIERSYNYDYWYQPYHNIMVSSEWAAPKTFQSGFNPAHVAENKYGQAIYFWDWEKGKIIKKVDLGADGMVPLELRFHHNPKSTNGYVGAALSSALWHWHLDESDKEWKVEKVLQIAPENVDGWPIPIPALISDVLISMDDRFLYFVNWLHGDIRQYDITEPSKPKLVGQVWCGGLLKKEPSLKRNFVGGPQMIQLSLDGKRLYVTNSLFSVWDDQFYPEMAEKGSQMIKINCDTQKGGLSIDDKFIVDFGNVPGGPYRAHETRYPGGDCTSDIWIS